MYFCGGGGGGVTSVIVAVFLSWVTSECTCADVPAASYLCLSHTEIVPRSFYFVFKSFTYEFQLKSAGTCRVDNDTIF